MKAIIYSGEIEIGTADLQIGDGSMGHIYGPFIPNYRYFSLVQRAVWAFWSTSSPDYNKWGELRLNVKLENDLFLEAQLGITIDDMEELPNEPKRIDVAGIDFSEIEHLI